MICLYYVIYIANRERDTKNPLEPLLLKLAKECSDSQDLSERLANMYKVAVTLYSTLLYKIILYYIIFIILYYIILYYIVIQFKPSGRGARQHVPVPLHRLLLCMPCCNIILSPATAAGLSFRGSAPGEFRGGRWA